MYFKQENSYNKTMSTFLFLEMEGEREREQPWAIGVKSYSVVLYCQKALETEVQGKES